MYISAIYVHLYNFDKTDIFYSLCEKIKYVS
jgi:hypothetical protein